MLQEIWLERKIKAQNHPILTALLIVMNLGLAFGKHVSVVMGLVVLGIRLIAVDDNRSSMLPVSDEEWKQKLTIKVLLLSAWYSFLLVIMNVMNGMVYKTESFLKDPSYGYLLCLYVFGLGIYMGLELNGGQKFKKEEKRKPIWRIWMFLNLLLPGIVALQVADLDLELFDSFLGNMMRIPCFSWQGRRIVMILAILLLIFDCVLSYRRIDLPEFTIGNEAGSAWGAGRKKGEKESV